jgi:hypothetical protein
MPWLHTETYPLPEEDVVTFSFGKPEYDLDKPVSRRKPMTLLFLMLQNRSTTI